MKLSKEVADILEEANEYTIEKGLSFITPETMLLKMCEEGSFSRAFNDCGGDVYKLVEDLEKYLYDYVGDDYDTNAELSAGLTYMISYAGEQAANSGRKEIGIPQLIGSLWSVPECYAVYYIEKQGVDRSSLLRAFAENEDGELAGGGTPYARRSHIAAEDGASDNWQLYAPCMNDMLDGVNPLIGREEEIERTIQVLCRKDKNNPLHIGEPGVGKTAITYGLAVRINEGRVPEPLLGSRIFMLDIGGLIAGTQYRGDFEKRVKNVLTAIDKEDRPIIYIDEIHSLAGAGSVGNGSHDASNMLKPYLSAGHIRFIGATTFDEYKKYFEKNKSIIRRFQNIEISEPGRDDAVKILEGLRDSYESFHNVRYADGVLEYAVDMSIRHINERFLPDKAIDLIDEAGSYRKLHPLGEVVQLVDKAAVAHVLTNICRVPVEAVREEENDNLATLETRIGNRVFCQDEAIKQVVNAVKFSRAGLLEDDKPQASLLFVGPTGVGKTEVAKALSEEMGVKLIRFDMSEYSDKYTVAKLIGAPAGYVGYEEGGLLTEEVRKNPSAVLLLDEIEKAHPNIYSVLLQVMDYATLTDNQGRKADFRNIILIMTSNAGANHVGKPGIGFNAGIGDNSALLEEVKRTFQPEFRNRLNKIVVFNGMDDQMASLVTDKKLRELEAQLSKKNVDLTVDDKAIKLIKKQGISYEFGAREVDRVIRNDIKPLFVDEILFGSLRSGGKVILTAEEDKFAVSFS